MKQVMIAIMALMFITNNAQAGFFDFLFKPKTVQLEQKHLHHHHRKLSKLIKKLKKKYNNKKKCRDNDFRSWRDLERSSTALIVEDESSITVTSDCDLRFKPMFSFKTDKVLTIEAKEIQFMSLTKLEAARMILVADKLDTAKLSKLCAEIVVLEADEAKHKGSVCNSAQVIGSVVGEPSAIANLTVHVAGEFVPTEVNFDWSDSFGVYTDANLDLGNGQIVSVNEKSYSYQYQDAGDYNVQVKLQTPGGEAVSSPSTFVLKEEEIINPIADFGIWHIINRAGEPSEVLLAPNLYPLVDADHSIKEYRYNFGDGSSLVMPFAEAPDGFVVHSFATMGSYEVELEVVTTDGFTKKVSAILDLSNPTNPSPKYAVSQFKGAAPLTVDFTGLAFDGAEETITYNWFFPDTGEQFFGPQYNQVSHTFTEDGVYYVYLETRDDLRGRRITYIPIYVGNVPAANALAPVAVTDSSARFGDGPLTVNFSAARSFDPNNNGTPLSYHWDFGDWRSGELNQAFTANAVHTFNEPGSYFVNLTVTNSAGLQHSEFLLVSVNGNDADDIDFEVIPTGNELEFAFSAYGYFQETDYSLESPRWSFGDNTYRANEPYVIHQYQAPGTYDVELKLRRVDGDYDSYTRRLQVTATSESPMVAIHAQSEWFNLGQPTQLSANFLAGTASESTIYRWSLGDGTIIKGQGSQFANIVHTYNAPGSKQVRLMVTADNGLTATAEMWLKHNAFAPEINGLNIYGLESKVPVRLGFAPYENTVDYDGNLSHFIYEFGDGTPAVTTTDGYLEHDYANAGIYTVAVTAVDSAGLQTRHETQIDLKSNVAPELADLIIKYDGSVAPTSLSLELFTSNNGEFIGFGSDSDGYIVAHEFDFGNGNVQTTSEPFLSGFYNEPGSYTVRARVQDNDGAWSNYITKNVTIKANQAPVIAHVPVYGDLSQPAPVRLSFAPYEGASDDQYIERWNYDFGDGSPLLETTDGYVEHDFIFPGSFNVVITAFDPQGLSSSYTIPLEIKANQPPVLADFNLQVPAQPAPVEVSVEAWPFISDSDGYVTTYEYSWGDGVVEQTSEGYVTHIYQQAGDYQVSVRVRDNNGEWSQIIGKAASIRANQAPLGEIACDNSQFQTLSCQVENLEDDFGVREVRWSLGNLIVVGEQAVFENIVTDSATISLEVEDIHALITQKTQSFEILQPSLIAVINCDQEGGNYVICSLGAQSQETVVESVRWFINNNYESDGVVFRKHFEEVGIKQIKAEIVDENGRSAVAEVSVEVTTIDTFPDYDRTPASLGVLTLAPPATSQFYNINEVLEIALEGESIDFALDDSGSYLNLKVELNGDILAASKIEEVDASQFKVLQSHNDGLNLLRVEGLDMNGLEFLKEFHFFAGNKKIIFNLVSDFGENIQIALDTIIGEQFKFEILAPPNNKIEILNAPTSLPLAYLVNGKTLQKIDLIGADVADSYVNVEGSTFSDPFSNQNLLFENGIEGWIVESGSYEFITNGTQRVDFFADSNGKENLSVTPDSSGRLHLKRGATVHGGKLPALDFQVASLKADDIILSAYRTSSGKFELVSRVGSALGGASGVLENDYRNLFIIPHKAQDGDLVELETLVITEPVPSFSSFLNFMGVSNLFAQGSPTDLLKIIAKGVRLNELWKLNGKLVDIFGEEITQLSLGEFSEYSHVTPVSRSYFSNLSKDKGDLIFSGGRVNRIALHMTELDERNIYDFYYTLVIQPIEIDLSVGEINYANTIYILGRIVEGRILFDIPSMPLNGNYRLADVYVAITEREKAIQEGIFIPINRNKPIPLLKDFSDRSIARFGERSYFMRGDMHINSLLAPMIERIFYLTPSYKGHFGRIAFNDGSKMNGATISIEDDPFFAELSEAQIYPNQRLVHRSHKEHKEGRSIDFRFVDSINLNMLPGWGTKLKSGNVADIDDAGTANALVHLLNATTDTVDSRMRFANITEKILVGYEKGSRFDEFIQSTCLENGKTMSRYIQRDVGHRDHAHIRFFHPMVDSNYPFVALPLLSRSMSDYKLSGYIEKNSRPVNPFLFFTNITGQPWAFKINGDYSSATDRLFYYDSNNEIREVPQHYDPDHDIYQSGDRLIHNIPGRNFRMKVLRTETEGICSSSEASLGGAVESVNIRTEVIEDKGVYSYDRGEVAQFKGIVEAPWASHPTRPRQYRARWTSQGEQFSGFPVGEGIVSSSVAFTPISMEAGTLSTQGLSLEVYLNSDESHKWSGNASAYFMACKPEQAFSLQKRSCGFKGPVPELIRCEPVVYHPDIGDGCEKWSFDANWIGVDSVLLCREVGAYDCNDRFAPSSYSYCGIGEKESSATASMDVIYHDYESSSDQVYTRVCTWSF